MDKCRRFYKAMKNFNRVALITIIQQIIILAIINFVRNEDVSGIFHLFIFIIYLSMYFNYDEIFEFKITKIQFKLYSIISWIILGFILTPLTLFLMNIGLLPDLCSGTWICLFPDYILLPIFIILYLIILGIIEFIIFIVKTIKN